MLKGQICLMRIQTSIPFDQTITANWKWINLHKKIICKLSKNNQQSPLSIMKVTQSRRWNFWSLVMEVRQYLKRHFRVTSKLKLIHKLPTYTMIILQAWVCQWKFLQQLQMTTVAQEEQTSDILKVEDYSQLVQTQSSRCRLRTTSKATRPTRISTQTILKVIITIWTPWAKPQWDLT